MLPQPGIYGACAFLTGGNREVEADKQILSPRPLLRVREHFSFVLRAAFRGGGGAGEGGPLAGRQPGSWAERRVLAWGRLSCGRQQLGSRGALGQWWGGLPEKGWGHVAP